MAVHDDRGSMYGEVSSADPTNPQARFTLLQTQEFVADLQARLDRAQHRVLIQLMTFDGDESGQDIADRLIRAVERGVKVRMLVDCFVFRFVSDQPVTRRAVRPEAEATKAMYERLRQAGVDLTFTHPHGPGNLFSLARNHKKLFIIDEDLYLGGINVSDHNFAWHDFMIRVEDDAILDAVVDDFEFTFAGGRRSLNSVIVTNGELPQVFDSLLLEAEHSVELASPYAIDVGLTQIMAKVTAPRKRVIATKRSNLLVYRAMSPFLKWRLRRSGTAVASYRNFSHSKYLLIDDEKLLIGSSNFGRHSFWCNQEICLLITDRRFIEQFKATLMEETEPMDEQLPAVKIAFGALVSYIMYGCVIGLRLTVASRVPNLSRL
ncbi:MAG: phospholipase D-like domain-containing protein [Acidimicrobiales bacterium]